MEVHVDGLAAGHLGVIRLYLLEEAIVIRLDRKEVHHALETRSIERRKAMKMSSRMTQGRGGGVPMEEGSAGNIPSVLGRQVLKDSDQVDILDHLVTFIPRRHEKMPQNNKKK